MNWRDPADLMLAVLLLAMAAGMLVGWVLSCLESRRGHGGRAEPRRANEQLVPDDPPFHMK